MRVCHGCLSSYIFIRPFQGRVVWCTLYVGVNPYAILCRTYGALSIGNDMWWHDGATDRNTL